MSDTQPLPLERIREIQAAHAEGRALIPCPDPCCKAGGDEDCPTCRGMGQIPEPEPPDEVA